MEYAERPARLAQLAPLIGALAAALLLAGIVTSVNELGWLKTAALAVLLVGAALAVHLGRRHLADAAYRVMAYRLPAGRRAGEHRPVGHDRTAQLVPHSWRMPTPPAGVPTLMDWALPRHPLVLP